MNRYPFNNEQHVSIYIYIDIYRQIISKLVKFTKHVRYIENKVYHDVTIFLQNFLISSLIQNLSFYRSSFYLSLLLNYSSRKIRKIKKSTSKVKQKLVYFKKCQSSTVTITAQCSKRSLLFSRYTSLVIRNIAAFASNALISISSLLL